MANELIRADLIEVKKALAEKPKRGKEKLVGIGVFSLEDLKKMKQQKHQLLLLQQQSKKILLQMIE